MHKTAFFIILHQTQASQNFLTILTKFDSKSILGGLKNPNFDLVVKTGWNECHYGDYQILIPTTIHGSKSELEWPIYHENRNDALIDAPLTFESHNFWSDRWIFKIHTFSEIGSQNISTGIKTYPIRGLLRPAALGLKMCARAINSRMHPLRQKKRRHFLGFSLYQVSLHVFSLFQTPKNTQNTHQSFLILLSSPKT